MAVELRENPSADLLQCAERPAGFPVGNGQPDDVIQKAVRAALERVMPAFGRNAARLDRWVEWYRPGSCPRPDS